uniref:Uncharacterized protein n=1 Tax=Panagrolaimus sp. PS1159 TaxID=55785 RepID=A0AC35FZ84_9BILA
MSLLQPFDFRPLSPPKSLTFDEKSGYLKITSNDFSTKFMYQLVFNVNNITLQYPNAHEHHHLAPLDVGEYLAILDANYIFHVSDIRNDSLSPWNKGNHKSKQHSFIVDEISGTCKRADTREERERSNAKEYYAKHPDQKVTKRIFLAITTGSIRPQANTFVVIYYKIDENLSHQSLINRTSVSSSQNHEQEDNSLFEDDGVSNIEIKEDPERPAIALLDGRLFTKGPTENNGTLKGSVNQTPSISTASAVLQSNDRKRSAITEQRAPVAKKPPKITILNPVASTPSTTSTSSSTNFIRKRHFGLFEHTPYLCDPPTNLQHTPQSSHIDKSAKNYYKANNLTVEAYHTSFPFQLQKGKDLKFKGKRKCAHCNAEVAIDDNTTVITHYEPFEYLISNSNHITSGHGNRVICIKFSCLKARYPFIDEKSFIVNNTVSQVEAKNVFDLIF